MSSAMANGCVSSSLSRGCEVTLSESCAAAGERRTVFADFRDTDHHLPLNIETLKIHDSKKDETRISPFVEAHRDTRR